MPKKIKKNPILTSPHADKIRMSKVIAEFAQPLLEEALDDKSAEVAILSKSVRGQACDYANNLI
jgi:hypothetical protein